MKISVVMPIHNEEQYLPYSLSSLVDAPIDELVIVLDRCTDRSKEIVERFKQLPHRFAVKVFVKEDRKWRSSIAEAFEYAFSKATGDIIYSMAGDFVTDISIYNPEYFDGYDMVSFSYETRNIKHFDLRAYINNFLRRYIHTSKYFGSYGEISGHFAVRQKIWRQIRFRDNDDHDTLFWHDFFKQGYKHRFIRPTHNFHLRPSLTHEKQLVQGESRARRHMNLLKVLIHSIVYVKPYVFVGYLHEKRKE